MCVCVFQARRSGEHWFDDLPHTTFLIFKGKFPVFLLVGIFSFLILNIFFSSLIGINLLVKSKAFQYAMCKCNPSHSAVKYLTINLLTLFILTADAVVAINGVWILVETYTLNSKICPDNINTCE